MIDLSDVELVRHALAKLCRNPDLRINPPNLEIVEHRWWPHRVLEPDLFMRFSDDGAWHFIADQLEAGQTIRCHPPTKDYPDYAYALVHSSGKSRGIYMKIALPVPVTQIMGISFHYEDPR